MPRVTERIMPLQISGLTERERDALNHLAARCGTDRSKIIRQWIRERAVAAGLHAQESDMLMRASDPNATGA